MMKVMTILGTRPEIIRLSETIKLLRKHTDHILVNTGQNYNYELNDIFFKDLNLAPAEISLGAVGRNLGETMGLIISKSYDAILEQKPDAILVLGDTNSALSAISAKRLKVPIFHMEAGNRCWDWNVSEMINRKIVDHISDINLPYTNFARRYLLSEGLDGKMTFVIGSPMNEVLRVQKSMIYESNILDRLGIGQNEYFVLSAHREENVDNDKSLTTLIDTVNTVSEEFNKPIIFSVHPRTAKAIARIGAIVNEKIRMMPPLSFSEYVNLQMNAYCTLSDSGTLAEESAILGFPAVLIRTSTERPEVMEYGTQIIGGISTESVLSAIRVSVATKGLNKSIPGEYLAENVSERVLKIILGYTEIVNRTIWGKQ